VRLLSSPSHSVSERSNLFRLRIVNILTAQRWQAGLLVCGQEDLSQPLTL